jgi:hypothetical protein
MRFLSLADARLSPVVQRFAIGDGGHTTYRELSQRGTRSAASKRPPLVQAGQSASVVAVPERTIW